MLIVRRFNHLLGLRGGLLRLAFLAAGGILLCLGACGLGQVFVDSKELAGDGVRLRILRYDEDTNFLPGSYYVFSITSGWTRLDGVPAVSA